VADDDDGHVRDVVEDVERVKCGEVVGFVEDEHVGLGKCLFEMVANGLAWRVRRDRRGAWMVVECGAEDAGRGVAEAADVGVVDVGVGFEAVECVAGKDGFADAAGAGDEGVAGPLAAECWSEGGGECFDLVVSMLEFAREVRVLKHSTVRNHTCSCGGFVYKLGRDFRPDVSTSGQQSAWLDTLTIRLISLC